MGVTPLLPDPDPVREQAAALASEDARVPAWLLSADGAVLPLAGAPYHGAPARGIDAVAITAADRHGYVVWTADGAGHGLGRAGDVGPLEPGPPLVAVVPTPGGRVRLRADGTLMRADGSADVSARRTTDDRAVAAVPSGSGWWVVRSSGFVEVTEGAVAAPEQPEGEAAGRVVDAVVTAAGSLALIREWSAGTGGPARHLLSSPIAAAAAAGSGTIVVTERGAVHTAGDDVPFTGALPRPAGAPVVAIALVPD